jgi:hypothetical protein
MYIAYIYYMHLSINIYIYIYNTYIYTCTYIYHTLFTIMCQGHGCLYGFNLNFFQHRLIPIIKMYNKLSMWIHIYIYIYVNIHTYIHIYIHIFTSPPRHQRAGHMLTLWWWWWWWLGLGYIYVYTLFNICRYWWKL